jgi:hypothetical protein
MAYFQGERVSTYWAVVLQEAYDQGVHFTVTSGQRTIAEQARLYYNPPAGTPRVAKPYPTAPHIRVGRQDHAIDVASFDGGETRLQAWLRNQGARTSNPVGGEAWHLEINASDLKKLYNRFKDPFPGYPADEKRWLLEYDRLKAANHDKNRRQVLVRVMTEKRKSIWHEAGLTGWHKNNRIKRYASLRARTK